MSLKFLFRVDASHQIGTGHVMRCLTLAHAIRSKGYEAIFVCRELIGNLCDLVEQDFQVLRLPLTTDFNENSSTGYEHWLTVPYDLDVIQTKALLEQYQLKIDWLIVDHYAIGYYWQSKMRSHVSRIMVIDDLANRRHDCDLLLDQNLYLDLETRYTELISPHCKQLLGSNYLMLRSEFLNSKVVKTQSATTQKILVTFGGVDTKNVTTWVLESLNQLEISHPLEIRVALGSNFRYGEEVQMVASQSKHKITIEQPVTTMANWMTWADLAVSTGGFTCYELAYMKVPTLVITVADNQLIAAHDLDQIGITQYLGKFEDVSRPLFNQALQQLMLNLKQRVEMSAKCESYFDGQGTKRVVRELLTN